MSIESAITPAVGTPRRLFANPHFQMTLSIVLSAAAQVLLKLGVGVSGDGSLLGFDALHSGWVWLGIATMIGSLFSWLYALRFIALSRAFTLAGAIHALVPIGCWVFLGETIPGKRWLGIALVIAGVLVSAQSAGMLEEKL